MVEVKGKAYRKIEAFVKETKAQGEVGGLLLGKIKKDDGDVIVKNAILIDQLKTGSTFEITEEAMMEFTKNASTKVLASVIGWWHSHCDFGTFWSIVDDDCFKRLCNLTGFCFGIVASLPKGAKELETRSRLDILDKNGQRVSIDNIQPDIDTGNFKLSMKNIGQQITEFVKDDNRTKVWGKGGIQVVGGNDWEVCPACGGIGTVDKDEYDQMMTEYFFDEDEETIDDKAHKHKEQIVDYGWEKEESEDDKYWLN